MTNGVHIFALSFHKVMRSIDFESSKLYLSCKIIVFLLLLLPEFPKVYLNDVIKKFLVES